MPSHSTTALRAALLAYLICLSAWRLIRRLYSITSERRLCEKFRLNLAYRWFLPAPARCERAKTLDLWQEPPWAVPGCQCFRLLFEQTVRRCVAAGLLARKDVAIDTSFSAADASWQRKMRDSILPRPKFPGLCRNGAPHGKPAAISRTDPGAAWSARTVRCRFGYEVFCAERIKYCRVLENRFEGRRGAMMTAFVVRFQAASTILKEPWTGLQSKTLKPALQPR
ncbi:hypothetical protein FHS54_002937 [Sphingobium vermicomposti]|uniref:Transposase n=1 Tax=Sphingobium vermicomposti TaxID=529005 RepID=A0A846M6M8_9SPHN|nr:hypothetical protein [Sphingobium vermicomposti]